MDVSPDASQQESYALRQAERHRRLAQECRELAPRLLFGPHRERVLEMARYHDAEATRFGAMVQG